MSATIFSSNGAGTPKRWARYAMAQASIESFILSRFVGGESERLPFVSVTQMEQGPGDELTTYLAAKIYGKPIQGEERAEGNSARLNDYTDKIKIDRNRKPVNIGNIMAQKRRPYNLKQLAARLIGEYWAEYIDEECMSQVSGRRGTGTNYQHLPMDYKGFPHAYSEPDAQHLMYPGTVTKATMTTADTMGRAVVEAAVLKAETQINGDQSGKPFKMQQVRVQGATYWLMCMHPAQMFDMRSEVGDAGWLTLEKARITAVGSNSPVFKGQSAATAMLNNCILHQHTSVTYQDDYGAGSNVRGFRALFMGAHAGAIAFGTSDRKKNGVRLRFGEADEDQGDDKIIKSQAVCGIKKCQYDGKDFAVTAVETSCSDAAKAAMTN